MAGVGATGVLGREAEMGHISRFLDRASECPAVLLLEGEPGIGKTTLWGVGVEAARQRGWWVLACRPVQAEAPLTFSALGDLLASVPESAMDALPRPQRHALDVALLLAPPADSPPDQRAVAVATLGVIRALASSAPVLVAVDDLPWLDRASAAALEYALRRLTTERTGLLATVSSGGSFAELPALERDLLVERVGRVKVGPLDLSSFGAMLNAKRDQDTSWPDLNRIYEASGGNPFFGLELMAGLQAQADRKEPLSVPVSLRAAAEHRLHSLSEPARETLLLVAAADRPTVEHLEAAELGTNVAAALDEAEAAGVITVTIDGVRFEHPILRLVHYSTATPRQRRQAHKRLAAATTHGEERARHLALAATGPDEAIARELGAQARVAHLRGAAVVGAELADLAVALTRPADVHARAARLVATGELHLAAFDPAGARRALKEAVAISEPGPLRADALHRLGRVVAYDESVITSKPLLLQALGESEPGSRLRAFLHRDLAFVIAMSEGMSAAGEHIAATEMLVDQLEDTELARQTKAHKALIEFLLGNGVRDDLIREAIHSPSRVDRIAMEIRPRVVIGRVLLYADDLGGARRLLLEEYDEAMAEGAETDLPLLLMPLVELETWAGRLDLADQYSQQCCSAAAASGATAQLACAHAARAMLRAWQGPSDGCRADAERAIEEGLRSGVLYTVAISYRALGLLALAEGDPAAAHAALGLVTQALADRGIVDPGFIPIRSIPDDVESLIRMGELDAAEQTLEPLADRASRLDRASALAAVGRCRALLASARGHSASAAASAEDALRAHEGVHTPLELGRTHLVAGEVARRARRLPEARTHVATAAAIFAECGAVPWVERASSELARLGRRRARRSEGGGLTTAEQAVAAAVAAGHTNREVAAELYMGLRTVEAHLSAVYRKLGVRSRSELAATWSGRSTADLQDPPLR